MFNNYISTSEFAKLVGVSKHTLFYYDKEGVFLLKRSWIMDLEPILPCKLSFSMSLSL